MMALYKGNPPSLGKLFAMLRRKNKNPRIEETDSG